MIAQPTDPALRKIEEKIEAGTRLDAEDGMNLYRTHDLLGLGALAHRARLGANGRKAYYVYNQHINYTNICKNLCRFCAFGREADREGAYYMTLDDVEETLRSREAEPITEIHIVGGVHPDLPSEYYFDLVRRVKKVRPQATVKAFTAVEIHHLAELTGSSLADTFRQLKECGLEAMPGGGAEVFSPRIREELYPCKIGADEWLEVMREAHRAGIRTNATMLYGHVETIEERVEHFLRLRQLQDEVEGFMAFVPLAFHSKNTRLSHLPPTTGYDDLKTVAVARLLLDNFPHIKAYWVMLGLKLAQVALSFGADDLDGTIVEEKISHTAGAESPKGVSRSLLRGLIQEAGFEPVERDAFYRSVEGTEHAVHA